MTITEIKKFLKDHKITYEDVSQKSGVPLTTIKYIFSGRTPNPRIDTMQAIEEALNLSAPLGIFSIPSIEPLPKFDLVPLLGDIACGEPILAEENIEDYIKVDSGLHASFALRCKGDSMILARICDGDIVYIKQQEAVENGEIAAVLIDNEATLKRVYKYQNRIELRAENPNFAPLNFEGDELNNIRILGKAVAFLSVIKQ